MRYVHYNLGSAVLFYSTVFLTLAVFMSLLWRGVTLVDTVQKLKITCAELKTENMKLKKLNEDLRSGVLATDR